MHHWYVNGYGESKTHRRAHHCEHCRSNPKGGCTLPFRKTRKVRWLAAMDRKPTFFKSLLMKHFFIE